MTVHVTKFSWNNPAVYPLIAAVTTGLSFLVYSGVRHMVTNPEVRVGKNRAETMADGDVTAGRARAYKESLFRSIAETRTSDQADRPNTRIF